MRAAGIPVSTSARAGRPCLVGAGAKGSSAIAVPNDTVRWRLPAPLRLSLTQAEADLAGARDNECLRPLPR
jgi:hypothetical protein